LKTKVVVLNPRDNVATAFEALHSGEDIELGVAGRSSKVKLLADIPFGHKFSIVPIAKGQPVYKYGEVIGTADRSIAPGDYVHIHNISSTRGRQEKRSTR
jgi:altronate dehydratase small subunit